MVYKGLLCSYGIILIKSYNVLWEYDMWMKKISTMYRIKNTLKRTVISCRNKHRVFLSWTDVRMRYQDVWNISEWIYCVTKITDPSNCVCTHSTRHTTEKKPNFNSKQKNCAFCFSKMQGMKIPLRKIPSCSTDFVVGFVKHSCLLRTCLLHICLNSRRRRQRRSSLLWKLKKGFFGGVSNLPSNFYSFSSVSTYPLLVLFLYRMAITSRFTTTFVVGLVLSKCTLEMYTIFQSYYLAIECWLRGTAYSKILSATTQLQPAPRVSQIRFD